MNIIKTHYFLKQLENLKKKFPKIQNDLENFEISIDSEPFSDL
jgi:DNA-binding protein YbaB